MDKYTIKDFRKQFPNDNACLDYIFEQRFGKDYKCPSCSKTGFYRVKNRKCYACAWCGQQIHPVANTIFHKSSTKLTDWFFALFLFSASKNGVSAKELERQLGCTYKTAWRIAKHIRKLMTDNGDKLSGIVEVDETAVGGYKRKDFGGHKKATVMGMVERGGSVKTKQIPNRETHIVLGTLNDNVSKGSRLMTDDFRVYRKTKRMGYTHSVINHSKEKYVKGDIYTNTIEGFWSQMKRSINGTYHAVSPKYLQSYADEFSFRYNHRSEPVFPHLLARLVG